MIVVLDVIGCGGFGVTFLVAEVFVVAPLLSDDIVDVIVVVDSNVLCFANLESSGLAFTMFFSKFNLSIFLFSTEEIIVRSLVEHGLFSHDFVTLGLLSYRHSLVI